MTLSLKQLIKSGFTTRQAKALIENTPEAPAAFPEHFANPTGDVAGLTAVLPIVINDGGYPIRGGLVTVEGGMVPTNAETPNSGGWCLFAPTQVVTDESGILFAPGGGPVPPGVYLAKHYPQDSPDPAPTTLPDGWTAGNTTGAGPVLPYLGRDGGDAGYYAGLVSVAPGAPNLPADGVADGWELYDIATPLTVTAISGADWVAAGGDPAPAGVFLGFRYTAPGDTNPPTAFPPGWSFQPHGVGAAGPVLAALGEAVKSKVSYLAVDGGTISSGVNDDVVNLHAGNLRESGGTGLVLGTDGKITVVEESLVSVTAQILPVAHTGGTLVELNFTDTDSPTWGPAVRLAATGGGIVSLSSTYRFPAGDQIWIELSTDGTFSTTEVPGRFWITATPV